MTTAITTKSGKDVLCDPLCATEHLNPSESQNSEWEGTHKDHQVLLLSDWPVQGWNQQPRLYQFFSNIKQFGTQSFY